MTKSRRANKSIYADIATCFFVGYLPIAPGTWASLLVLPLYYIMRSHMQLFAVLTFVLIPIGIYTAGRAEKEFGGKDPGKVVIDEICGQMIVFLFIPFSFAYMAAGFVMFRILDVFKLPVVKKEVQDLPGGWGIMMDDVAVALFINVVFQILNWR